MYERYLRLGKPARLPCGAARGQPVGRGADPRRGAADGATAAGSAGAIPRPSALHPLAQRSVADRCGARARTACRSHGDRGGGLHPRVIGQGRCSRRNRAHHGGRDRGRGSSAGDTYDAAGASSQAQVRSRGEHPGQGPAAAGG